MPIRSAQQPQLVTRPGPLGRYGLLPVADSKDGPLQGTGYVSSPTNLEWAIAIFAVIIQMGAFVSLPMIVSGGSLMDQVKDPFNTIAIAVTAACVGAFAIPRMRQLGLLALKNWPSVLFTLIVLASALWSIHPDLTIRRGAGYVLTIVIAAYLSVRFAVEGSMRVLSWGFALAAIASLLFVAVFPEYGIMGDAGLAGEWRGVFPHKNVLGPTMAVALFTELYLLVVGHGRPRWRWGMLSIYLALVVLSHSVTAWFLAVFYLAGTGVYLLWRRERLAGALATTAGVLCVVVALVAFWSDPARVLNAMGKDVTLTGRTALWNVVTAFIEQRPILGWGYRAMWQVDDASAGLAQEMAKQWGVIGSHNTFLEITLQLGLVGMGVLLMIIGIALWRALRCSVRRILPLGWFSLMFFLGSLMAAQTLDWTLGQNQVIEWVVFNVLAFSCGLALTSGKQAKWANSRPPATSRRPEPHLNRNVASQ